jgi:hypothetical protein
MFKHEQREFERDSSIIRNMLLIETNSSLSYKKAMLINAEGLMDQCWGIGSGYNWESGLKHVFFGFRRIGSWGL